MISMEITRTEIIHIKNNLYYFTHIAKNIFNEFNYITRQRYFDNSKLYKDNKIRKNDVIPSETSLYNSVSPENNVLPKKSLQWLIKTFRTIWFSYFRALKEYYKNPDKFLGKPNIPHYKDKNGEFILIFTNQQCSIDNGILKFPKIINISVKTRLNDDIKLMEVRIIPLGNGYNIEIVYKKNINKLLNRNKRIIGIDTGVDNIAAITNNTGLKPVIVKGGIIKSINQFYNKQISKLKSINDVLNKNNKRYTRYTNKMKLITDNRNRKINDLFHKLSTGIINYCLLNNIDTIVIGHNNEWKQNVNIGKINNQNFVQIPFNKLIKLIKYKAEENGIEVILQEESYTSKCSFLDNESIEKHDKYLGKRIFRGLFRTFKGILINADINGSYNIIKKAFPNAFDGIAGLGVNPESLSIFKLLEKTTFKDGC